MIFFISDTHFNHGGSLRWGHNARPFSSVSEMNNFMVTKWNSVVQENDVVYIIGDFAYKCHKNAILQIEKQLNGVKHLIEGNHDIVLSSKLACWESVSQIKQINVMIEGKEQEIILCHYPMLSWRHSNKGSWQLHGHTHGTIQQSNQNCKRLDLSVECWDYTPVSLNQVVAAMNSKVDR